eukprot:2802401-Rhodomonas_salina.4
MALRWFFDVRACTALAILARLQACALPCGVRAGLTSFASVQKHCAKISESARVCVLVCGQC